MTVTALKDLRKLLRQFDAPPTFANFPRELRREKSDRAVMVMCVSFIDVGLKTAIAMKMKNKAAAIALFDDSGPLHSFGAKVKLAQAMGIFGPETRTNLDIIQTIRNAFAHSLSVRSFSAPEIEKACNALQLPSEHIYSAYTAKKLLSSFDTPRQRVFAITFLVITASMFAGVPIEEDENGSLISPPMLP